MTIDELRARMREAGWSVAVHNDYRLNGVPHTFWLWTHPNGRWVKGEGQTDAEALLQCDDAAANVKALDAEITRLREDLGAAVKRADFNERSWELVAEDRRTVEQLLATMTTERDDAVERAALAEAGYAAARENRDHYQRRAEAAEAALAVVTRERDEARASLADHRKDQGYIIGWNSGWDEAFSRLRFPTMLRKMWSGGEVQRWLDERKAEQTSPPPGSLSERLFTAEAALAKMTEEVARLKAELACVKPDHRAVAKAVADAENVEMLPVVRIERHEVPAITQEPTNAD